MCAEKTNSRETVLAGVDEEKLIWRLFGAATATLALLWIFRRVIVEEIMCMGGFDVGRDGEGP
jgi:hypothetical protein